GVLLTRPMERDGELQILVRPWGNERPAAAECVASRGAPAPVDVNALRTTRRGKGEPDRRRDRLERLVIVVPVSRRAVGDGLEGSLGPDVPTPKDRIGDVDLDPVVEVHLYELDDVVVLEGGGEVRADGIVSEEAPRG